MNLQSHDFRAMASPCEVVIAGAEPAQALQAASAAEAEVRRIENKYSRFRPDSVIGRINAGAHANPTFAGDTVYAWSEVLERIELPGRTDVGALRLRTVATKDAPCADFPHKGEDGKYLPEVVLDLDYTVLVPRR